MKLATHLPRTRASGDTGAVMSTWSVPSFLSSENDLIVKKGIMPGEQKRRPTIKEESGGNIQFVPLKCSRKNRKQIPMRETK